MITYTKKNLDFLTFLITLLIFLLIYLANSISLFSFYDTPSKTIQNSNQVYSKIFPIKQENSNQEIADKTIASVLAFQSNSNIPNQTKTNNTNQEITQNENSQTQRQTIQKNKTNKWRIQIPRINLDVHIQEGTSYSVLLEAVGHFEGTAKWNGNVGLAAHNRGYQCNFFEKIRNLKIGDEIIYTTTNGKKVYKVQTNKLIQDTDWSYLEDTQDNRITLITCEENRREYRRCVQAVEIANYQI